MTTPGRAGAIGPSIEDIKREARARLHEVLAKLGISDRPRGKYLSICNPVEKERHPSFTIWVRGPAAGGWRDERDPIDTRGDVVDLVSYVLGWWSRPKKGRAEALRW